MTEKHEAKIIEAIDENDIDFLIRKGQQEQFIEDIKVINYNNSYIGQVQEFHKFFNQVVSNKPTKINKETINLRLNLILEELSEIAEGCGKEILSDFIVKLHDKSVKLHSKNESNPDGKFNINEIFDALLDTQYVLSGTVLAFGFQDIFEEGFQQVHESNMTKACYSLDEAKSTVKNYSNTGTECFIDMSDEEKGIWRVMRTGDKKILKSINYKPFEPSRLIIESNEL